MANPDIHIIGAGPVGLAAALLLAAQDRRVTIHEARDAISFDRREQLPDLGEPAWSGDVAAYRFASG